MLHNADKKMAITEGSDLEHRDNLLQYAGATKYEMKEKKYIT